VNQLNTFDSIRIILYRKDGLKYPVAVRIVNESVRRNKTIIEFNNDKDLNIRLNELKKNYKSKEVLILNEFMGRKFQKCPGSRNVICCNYYLLNTCFNCLYNCTYCFLNSYLNSYGIIQFINLEDITENIRSHTKSINHPVRIGTGEFTDSLMFDEITMIASDLIMEGSSINNLFLEFKTKSSNISHLKNIENKGNAVLAWSVNTQRNIDLYEEGASNLAERINAARIAQQWGFNTAFHFDPIIRYDGFIEDYYSVIELISEKLDPSKIIWISMGCFRYSPGFKDIIKHSFPSEKITLEEMFPGRDGKYRYLAAERVEIFRMFRNRLQFHFPRTFIYLCMEDSDIWHRVFGKKYNTSEDLENDFNRYLHENFMK
jgi:spore photoproduct lyase